MKSFKGFIAENVVVFGGLVDEMESEIQSFKVMHWNIQGENFLPIHGLLGDIYDGLIGFQDRIAEKVRGAGVKAVLVGKPVGQPTTFDVDAVIGYALGCLTSLRSKVASSDMKDPTIDNIVGELCEAIDGWVYKLQSSQ